MEPQQNHNGPLDGLDEWEDDLLRRYPSPDSVTKSPDSARKGTEDFRDYGAEVRPSVREFYRLNHRFQTCEFVRKKRTEYLSGTKRRMGIWEAMEFLNTLVDDSDPDTDLSQIEHLLQTSEAIRADGHPRWFILTGLIHDLGKVLCLFGEPQWAVVGDTFPVGCAYSERIVFHEFFKSNLDDANPTYSTRLGVYQENCGLNQVLMSWGHDEYLHHVVKKFLPEPALYMIRYHSFYAAHREGEYDYLMNDRDREMFNWVRQFNPYDLYSKSDVPPNVDELRPYYEDLIAEFFPAELSW